MEIRKVLSLQGPNVWARFPVLEAWVALGSLTDFAPHERATFSERLALCLPMLAGCRSESGMRGGGVGRAACVADTLAQLALEWQRLAGTEVNFGRAHETTEAGVYRVAVEYQDEDLGRASFQAALETCLAAIHGHPFDPHAALARLRELADRTRPDPVTAAIVLAARRRGIPVRTLAPGLLQLGYGALQHRVLRGRTSQTSALAEAAAGDWKLTRSLLQAAGVPVHDGTSAGQEPVHRLLVVGERVVSALRPPLDGASCAPPPGDAAERLHPEVAVHAASAAKLVGLDLACIDVVAEDLGRPLKEEGGGVAAVRPAADLGCPADPGCGPLRALGEAAVNGLFPDGQTGRIPVVAVTGVNGKTTTTRLIAHLLADRGRRTVGMTCTEGIYVGGRRIEAGDCSGPLSAGVILQNPRVEAAVLETARGGILRAGLGFDRCDVAVVTNIGEGDHLGIGGIDTLEQLARVKRTTVEAVPPGGAAVLKADDPLVAAMAAACKGAAVFFARDCGHPVIAGHRARGGRAAFVRDSHVVLAEGKRETALVPLDRVPLTHGGRIGFQVENVLAAAAAAWSLGVPYETTRAGLESFAADLERTPARFNVLEVNHATVIMDYGHNVSSLVNVIEALDQFPHRRRTAVYTAAGDRRDADLIRQGELLGDAFDRVILYEDENCCRGRKEGEITALFRRGLDGRRASQIEEVKGALNAVRAALASARPGELLLVQVDLVDETVDLLRNRLSSAAAREIGFPEAAATLCQVWDAAPARPPQP